ncbi:sporulation protein YpjB [Paenibacillus glycanilyticus]|uniref:sporulation protein YpjB n=1 Tax=Paenibacillus glycanilyticus TaxID=126569 RepID=UPI00203D3243|nr:sporulation protein YpjB [Paenibacillus glycanilyticus]MCM3627481.1 sporulation protein YpjB [Paenibacillus glycanilyticus]
MKIRFVLPLVLCIVMTVCSVTAAKAFPADLIGTGYANESRNELLRLDETAAALYEAAYLNNRQAGYKYVQQLEKLMSKNDIRQAGQAAGWELMEDSISSITSTLKNGKVASDWLTAAARIHLTTDALLRPDHALWLQYEKVMLEDLERVNRSWNRQTDDGAIAARAAMNSFNQHLSRIEAAASMQRPAGRIDELRDRMHYTNVLLEAGMKGQTKQDWTDNSIQDLEFAVSRLFDDGHSQEEEPVVAPIGEANPISWILLLGAIIMAVLTYSGWRKYKQQPYGVKPLS